MNDASTAYLNYSGLKDQNGTPQNTAPWVYKNQIFSDYLKSGGIGGDMMAWAQGITQGNIERSLLTQNMGRQATILTQHTNPFK